MIRIMLVIELIILGIFGGIPDFSFGMFLSLFFFSEIYNEQWS